MAKKPRPLTRTKRLKRFLIRLGFWSFYYFIGLLPASWAYALGRGAGRLAAVLPFAHRHTIFENLALAYGGEKTLSEQKKIARRVFINIGELLVDLILMSQRAASNNVTDKVTIEGRENLDQALAKGKGVMALTGHLGLFLLINPRLNAAGYNCWVVADYQYDPHLEKHIEEVKRRLGVRTIMTEPKDVCLRRSLECLNDGGVLVLLMDEDAKRRGIFVDFFGRAASTATGPAAMALRTGAAVVPMAMVYEGQGRHRLVMEPPLELINTGELTADIAANTVLFTKALENIIRRNPDQWAWINKRWKTKPNPTP